MKINAITHPDYDLMQLDWAKFRYAYTGGRKFIDNYLTRLSIRETPRDFDERLKVTYCPSHAKAAINKIKNSIYQRMSDIIRDGGPVSYQEAITANDGMGVDREGRSMTGFIGTVVLPELLSMGVVGVYVDKPKKVDVATLRDKERPYVYIYKCEDIRSYSYDSNNLLSSILLRDHDYANDVDTGLVTGYDEGYRLLKKTNAGVEVHFYDTDGNEDKTRYTVLSLKEIPFIFVKIAESLMTDVADYQVALLNLASSDMSYALKANFPFYTEQYSPQADNNYNLPVKLADPDTGTLEGTASDAGKAGDNEIKIGTTAGRRYPKGLERPGFINPSPEPLRVSMEKQEKLKEDIQQLVNLGLQNVNVNRESTKSREYDNQGLEAGLAYIGMILELAEQNIAKYWCAYENTTKLPVIKYPTKYSLLTDEERLNDSKQLQAEMIKLPSKTYQKAIAKRIIALMLGTKVDYDELQKMFDEIDAATVVAIDPEIIKGDHEAGFVSTETASLARGYPKGEVEQAKKDHAERAARIALAQSKAGARGVADMSNDDSEGDDEKETSQSPDTNTDAPAAKVRE